MSTTLDHHTPHTFVDPYAADPSDTGWPPAAGQHADFLPPPNPAERLNIHITPRDQRRLALHAALTAAGIPPRPEDRDAIDQLSTLPPSTHTALQRWLHQRCEAGAPPGSSHARWTRTPRQQASGNPCTHLGTTEG